MAPAKKKYKTVDEALFYANQKQGKTQPIAGLDGTTFPRDRPIPLSKEKGNPEDTFNKMYGFKGVAKPAIKNPVIPISSKKKKPTLGDGWSYNTTKA
jgi:hypothetical protein